MSVMVLGIFLAPVLLFRPLVNSIADRIAGKQSGAKEIKGLKEKVVLLESEIHFLREKLTVIEDTQEFSRKLLEDIKGRDDTPSAD